MGGSELDSSSGQIMAYINDPKGRICNWDIPLIECYGIRLPIDYNGEVPQQMQMIDIPTAEYIVFENVFFNFETENNMVEEKIEKAMKNFDFSTTNYCLDNKAGRIAYFYHDSKRYWKYIRPVKRKEK